MSILKATKYINSVVAPGLETIPDKSSFITYKNYLLRRDKVLKRDNEPPAKVAFDQSVTDLKDESKVCASGKKAVIDPKKLSFRQFMKALSEDNGKNGLGCGGGTPYVTYEDGKYCCAVKGLDDQQLFDYINILLNGAMANVDDTMFIKNREMIGSLIGERERLIAKYNSALNDTIVLPVKSEKSDHGKYTPYTSIYEWFDAASAQTDILKKNVRSDYDTGQVISDEVDAEFYNKQKELYKHNAEMRKRYSFPSEAPSRRGLPEEQKSTRHLPNYNDEGDLVDYEGDLVADPLVVEKDADKPKELTIAPKRGLQRSKRNRTIKRNRTRRRNRNKNGGSHKKITTRNKRK